MAFPQFLSLPFHSQFQSCFQSWSQGRQCCLYATKYGYGSIWPCTGYVLYCRYRVVRVVCMCFMCSRLLPLRGVYVSRQIYSLLQKVCLLKCVCYQCKKHGTTTAGQKQSSQLCSANMKVRAGKRDAVPFLSTVSRSLCLCA